MAKKQLIPEAPKSKMSILAERLSKKFPGVQTAGGLLNSYRYIDFCDPKSGRPALSLEWLFGARGLWAGRILNLIAHYSKGKSSFMYFMYACAQRLRSGAWCNHGETEGAPPPPDFIASYGADPDDLMVAEPRSLEEAMSWVDETEANIRGAWGTGVDPETGKAVKSKFTEPLDAEMTQPILFGIDSLSALGIEEKTMTDVSDKTKTAQPGNHAKKLREYLSERNMRFKQRYVSLMLASHQTANINMGGGMKPKGADINCKAKDAIGIYATYEVTVEAKQWRDKDPPYAQYGDIVTLRTTKNKMAPRYRELNMYLRTNKGFDITQTEIEWLFGNPNSPFVRADLKEKFGEITRRAGTIKCLYLQEKAFESYDAFLDALYADKEFLPTVREALRLRGFGFKFETDYRAQLRQDAAVVPEAVVDPDAIADLEETPEET